MSKKILSCTEGNDVYTADNISQMMSLCSNSRVTRARYASPNDAVAMYARVLCR